jgi:hypothetical protein
MKKWKQRDEHMRKKFFFYSKINLIRYFKIFFKNNIVKLRLMIIIILNKDKKIISDYF